MATRTTRVGVRVSKDEAKQVSEVAKERGFLSPSAFLREAVRNDIAGRDAELTEAEHMDPSIPNARTNDKDQSSESLKRAGSIARQALGDSTRVLTAETDSGTYRREVIGETERHVIQRQSGKSVIAHPRELLDRQPEVGETVRINYSNDRGSVREFRDRSKPRDTSR